MVPAGRAAGINHTRVSSISIAEPQILPENESVIAEREEDDALNEIIMALDTRDRGTVGCCYYVAREEKLFFLEDVKLGGLEVVESCAFSKSTLLGAVTDVNSENTCSADSHTTFFTS